MRFVLFLLAMFLPFVAVAGQWEVFGNTSTAVGETAVVKKVTPGTKTVFSNGRNYATGAFQNMSGEVIIKGGPTTTGPWFGIYSTTTNSSHTWTDSSQFIQITWRKVKRTVSVWLSYLE